MDYDPVGVALKFGFLAVLFLYVFLVGIKALEKGIGSLGAGFVDDVFATVAHPLAGLAAGILATVLVQSSSVTTSTHAASVSSRAWPSGSVVWEPRAGTTTTS